jgi:hypothetical protein
MNFTPNNKMRTGLYLYFHNYLLQNGHRERVKPWSTCQSAYRIATAILLQISVDCRWLECWADNIHFSMSDPSEIYLKLIVKPQNGVDARLGFGWQLCRVDMCIYKPWAPVFNNITSQLGHAKNSRFRFTPSSGNLPDVRPFIDQI